MKNAEFLYHVASLYSGWNNDAADNIAERLRSIADELENSFDQWLKSWEGPQPRDERETMLMEVSYNRRQK